MRKLALSRFVLWTLIVTGCQNKSAKVKRLQDQYNPEFQTGEKLTPEQTAALEAKKQERDARCKPETDRLAQIQKEIIAAQQ
jgi:hypothetical protein